MFLLQVHVPLPNAQQRLHILKVHLRGESLAPSVTPAELEAFAKKAERLSGSDLFEICREAALRSLRIWLNKGVSGDSPPTSPANA